MKTALIGHTGFVGSNLNRQLEFDRHYNSQNIEDISGEQFDVIYCAGIQAKKWWANLYPDEDRVQVERLMNCLETVEAGLFVMISTIDVYDKPDGVDESTPVDLNRLSPYGLHRLNAENFIRDRFEKHLIVRLPGLFGQGLKKNVLYDLLNDNETNKINVHHRFQYYDLRHLGHDIDRSVALGADLINIATEPIKTLEIVQRFFPGFHWNENLSGDVSYDMRSAHWRSWESKAPGYLYTKEEVLSDMGGFIDHNQRQGL